MVEEGQVGDGGKERSGAEAGEVEEVAVYVFVR